jgi:two-component system LytT family response regulator
MVSAGSAIQFVDVADIEWVEGADYYVTLHAGGKEFLYRESLKHLEERLDPGQFIRIHVSAIVNLAKVKEIRRTLRGEYQVVLTGGQKLPVSRRRRKDLINLGVTRFGLKA